MEIKDSFWGYLSEVQQKNFYRQQRVLQNMITVIQNGQTLRVSPDGDQGLAASRTLDQGHICYEFKIPLTIDEEFKYSIHADAGEQVGITFGLKEQIPDDFPGEPAAYSPIGPYGGSAQRTVTVTSDIHLQLILAKPE
jgi:hypothetical protein